MYAKLLALKLTLCKMYMYYPKIYDMLVACNSSFDYEALPVPSLQGLTFTVLQDVVQQLQSRENNLLHRTFQALAAETRSSDTPGQSLRYVCLIIRVMKYCISQEHLQFAV